MNRRCPCPHHYHANASVQDAQRIATSGMRLPWNRMEVMESWRSVKWTRWSLGSRMASLALASSCWTPSSVLALSARHEQLSFRLQHSQSASHASCHARQSQMHLQLLCCPMVVSTHTSLMEVLP